MSAWSYFRVWPRAGALPATHAKEAIVALAIGEVALAAVLALPPVARATGIAPLTSVVLLGTHLVCMVLNLALLIPRAATRPAAWHASLVFALVVNLCICLGFVVASGRALTLWWMAPLVFAMSTGATELDPSIIHAAAFLIGPFAMIPLLVTRGAPLADSFAGAAVTGVLSLLAYNQLAVGGARDRDERERLRRQIAELEHARLARDLHDGVGSALAVLGIYADLIDRSAHDPRELARIAGELRLATREGMAELRGVLDALGPERSDLATLARTLRTIANRAAGAVAVKLVVSGGATAEVSPPLRLALVRVFQEALANAIRHGGAQVLDVELAARDGSVELAIADDGCGFEPAGALAGRGLASMRRRAEELGGTLDVLSRRGHGTRIHLRAPA